MHSCREISALLSRSLDSNLSLRERLAVNLHLMMCIRCENFKKQLLFMRKAAGRYTEHLEKRPGRK